VDDSPIPSSRLSNLADMSTPASLDRLRSRQHDIVTRAQLRAAGVTPSRLKAELAAGRWRRLNDRVVCLHNTALTRRQALWAVVLSTSGPVALAGLTVYELFRVTGFPCSTVHVVVPKGARVLPVPGVWVEVHQFRAFPKDCIRLVDHLPVTYGARAVVDAATFADDVFTATRILVAGVQQLRYSATEFRELLLAAPRARHRRVLLLLAGDLEGGAHALSEVDFLKFCKRHRFPRPQLQARLDSHGRRRYLDAKFINADGDPFMVEIDGGVHLKLEVRERDTIKDNDAVISQHRVLRYVSVSIHTDHPDAIRQIRTMLDGRRSASGAARATCAADRSVRAGR